MKIILNSDIIFVQKLLTNNLPRKLEILFRTCAERNHIIVIPLTTLLEFNKKQSEHVQVEISKLSDALTILNEYKISHDEVKPYEMIKEPDLIKLIESYGVMVEVEEPSYEDFKDAHERACLKTSPHPPDKKSDEMRDLVIWNIAIRLSLKEGGALLISSDKVHSNPLGDEEAEKSSLVQQCPVKFLHGSV